MRSLGEAIWTRPQKISWSSANVQYCGCRMTSPTSAPATPLAQRLKETSISRIARGICADRKRLYQNVCRCLEIEEEDPYNGIYTEEALQPRGGHHDLVWLPPEKYPSYVPGSQHLYLLMPMVVSIWAHLLVMIFFSGMVVQGDKILFNLEAGFEPKWQACNIQLTIPTLQKITGFPC